MSKFVPQELPEEDWIRIDPNKDYAIRSGEEDHIFLRLGLSQGIYLVISPDPAGRLVQSVVYDTGVPTLVGKIPREASILVGRGSDMGIKVLHAIVSRQHLEVRLDANVLVVRDVGSTNGTYILKDNVFFEIESYLAQNPIETAPERTADAIHEAFGPTLDDFLKRYSERKGKTNDENSH